MFSSTSSGAKLSDALSSIKLHELQSLLPPFTIEVSRHLYGDIQYGDLVDRLAATIPPKDLIVDSRTFAILYNILPSQKRREFCARFTIDLPETGDFHGNVSKDLLHALIEFYGGVIEPEDKPHSKPQTAVLSPRFGLFRHQIEAVHSIDTQLSSSPEANPATLLHMPTGAGKTRTASHFVTDRLRNALPCLVVWVAHSAVLLEQALETIKNAWAVLGNRDIEVVRFWGNDDVPNIPTDGILIAGLQKLHSASDEVLFRIAEKTSLVVVDEAHISVAPTYESVISTLLTNIGTELLGLTATPGRTWNDPQQDKELSRVYNGTKTTLRISGYENPVTGLIAEGYLARTTFRRLEFTGEAGRHSTIDISENGDDEYDTHPSMPVADYLSAVVDSVLELSKRHSRIMVFGARVDLSRTIDLLLKTMGLGSMFVSGETPTARREEYIRRFRSAGQRCMVLVNYGVLTTGFDAPNTSAAVIARPTRSLVLYSQMVGRAIRGPKAGGNSNAEIVSIVDLSLPGFDSICNAFENWEDVWNP